MREADYYVGTCVKGPWSGQTYTHWCDKFQIFEPVVGTYELAQGGLWVWIPAGKE